MSVTARSVYNIFLSNPLIFLNLSGKAALEFLTMSEPEIRELNFKSRKIDKPTDVLSFPEIDGEIKGFTKENYPYDFDPELGAVFIGSIVMCPAIAAMQAKEYGHSLKREKSYLFVHGLLHLMGFDHKADADKKLMRAKEEEILLAACDF